MRSEKQILFTDNENVIHYAEFPSMKEIRTFTGHLGSITAMDFLADSVLVSGSSDGIIKFWSLKQGAALASLFIIDSVNWTVTSPSGLFDASPGAMSDNNEVARMYYVVTDTLDQQQLYKIIKISQLKQRYYQPGLLSILLGYRKEAVREVPALGKIEFAPSVSLGLENDSLVVRLKNKGGGIGKVSVFVEGSEALEDARPAGIKAGDQSLKFTVDLKKFSKRFVPETDNLIKVVAWNQTEWLSSDPSFIAYKPTSVESSGQNFSGGKPGGKGASIYGVVVGTSQYTGGRLNLMFAAKDASDFYDASKNSAEELVGKERVHMNLFTTDLPPGPQFPSKKNIVAALQSLVTIDPQDVLILYFSGHGVNYGGQDGDFYYLTYQCSGADANDLKDPIARDNNTISSRELIKLLREIPARKKVLILDACASGKAAEVMVSLPRDLPASQVRLLDQLSRRTGFYVLSSSAADAASYETSIYGQSLLTYALLKAIRGSALIVVDGEEYVDVQKLLQFAVDEVPNLSKGISGNEQQPAYRSPGDQTSYSIGKVTKNVKDKIHLAEPKPVFMSSDMQEEMQFVDVLKFREKLDAQLQQNAARGRKADLVFTQGMDYPNAYQIYGRYARVGTRLKIKYFLKKNLQPLGPYSFDGDVDNLDTLSEQLIDTVIKDIKQK
jgi:hypothetical protein